MRVIFLSAEGTFVLDLLAWLFFHLGIGYFCSQLPITRFDPNRPLYLTYPWEKNGKIYEKLLRVRLWKEKVPEGGKLYPNTFSLKRLASLDLDYLERWLRESCRAEFCHWLLMLPGLLFFLWNDVMVGWLMVGYAVLNNILPIAMQRFNRPRIRRMIRIVQRQTPNQTPAYQPA
jgi:glycosyl-4,4'-diaponeurosporenoate acyltransferase